METTTLHSTFPSPLPLSELRATWNVKTTSDLETIGLSGPADFLVEGWIPRKRIILAAGDSGLGKSPLMYQLGMAIAAGVDVLGRKVQKGRVLYLDGENGLAQMETITKALSRHLKLEAPPEDFLMFSLTDPPLKWGQTGYGVNKLIEDARPALVVVDTVSTFWPGIEEKNVETSKKYAELRGLIGRYGCSFALVHHLKKEQDGMGKGRTPLEDASNVRKWFEGVRGPSALVNNADVRLGIDLPSVSKARTSAAGKRPNVELVVLGFERLSGSIPVTHLTRERDEDGEPLGYRLVRRVELFDESVQEFYEKLPAVFTHKEAKHLYGRGSQATGEALDKLKAAGLVVQPIARGSYQKLKPADLADE